MDRGDYRKILLDDQVLTYLEMFQKIDLWLWGLEITKEVEKHRTDGE